MNAKNKKSLNFLTPWKKVKKEIVDSDTAKENNLNVKNLSLKAKCMKVLMCVFSFKAFYVLMMSDNLRHLKANTLADDMLIVLTVLVLILNLIPQAWLIKFFKVKERQEKRLKQIELEKQKEEQEINTLFEKPSQEIIQSQKINKTLNSSL
jgi:hypothetical protein